MTFSVTFFLTLTLTFPHLLLMYYTNVCNSIPLWNTKNHYTVFTNDFSFFDTKNSLNLTLISFIWTSPPLLLMYSINFSAWDLSSLDASEKNLENPGRDTSARAKYCDWNLKWKVLNARRTATGMEKLRSNYCQDFIVLL